MQAWSFELEYGQALLRQLRRCREFAAVDDRGGHSYIERRQSVIDGVNQHLYYLNQQVDDKKHKITTLEQEQGAAAEQSERDRLASELTTLRYELDGLEREREADKARREEVGREVSDFESRIGTHEAELERSRSLMSEKYREMVDAHAIMTAHCEPGDVPPLP